jgi:hypothetical protein
MPRLSLRRWPRSFRILLRIHIALFLLAGALWLVENWRGHRALERELARLKAAGEPLTWEELATPEPAPEDNFGAVEPLRGIGGADAELVRIAYSGGATGPPGKSRLSARDPGTDVVWSYSAP